LQYYTKMQEGARKDVEHAFGVLQARWEIVKNPVKQWDLETVTDIMIACIIMHNMIIEDEEDLGFEQLPGNHVGVGQMHGDFTYRELEAGTREIENMHTHFVLQNDIIDHLWVLRGQHWY
jgi:hypothetical protein